MVFLHTFPIIHHKNQPTVGKYTIEYLEIHGNLIFPLFSSDCDKTQVVTIVCRWISIRHVVQTHTCPRLEFRGRR